MEENVGASFKFGWSFHFRSATANPHNYQKQYVVIVCGLTKFSLTLSVRARWTGNQSPEKVYAASLDNFVRTAENTPSYRAVNTR